MTDLDNKGAASAAPASAPQTNVVSDREARLQEEIDHLHEVADGAWGDNPAVRGAARDRLKKLEPKNPQQLYRTEKYDGID